MKEVASADLDLDWEDLAEKYAFIFHSCDLKGNVRYVNRAWHDAIEHDSVPAFVRDCAPNRNLRDAFSKGDAERFLRPVDHLRLLGSGCAEQIVPFHTPNEFRWAFMRMQRFAEEIVFSYFFLRHYTEIPPAHPRIRCLLDSGSSWLNWEFDDSPLDAETSIGLCPGCSAHLYTFLREEN